MDPRAIPKTTVSYMNAAGRPVNRIPQYAFRRCALQSKRANAALQAICIFAALGATACPPGKVELIARHRTRAEKISAYWTKSRIEKAVPAHIELARNPKVTATASGNRALPRNLEKEDTFLIDLGSQKLECSLSHEAKEMPGNGGQQHPIVTYIKPTPDTTITTGTAEFVVEVNDEGNRIKQVVLRLSRDDSSAEVQFAKQDFTNRIYKISCGSFQPGRYQWMMRAYDAEGNHNIDAKTETFTVIFANPEFGIEARRVAQI